MNNNSNPLLKQILDEATQKASEIIKSAEDKALSIEKDSQENIEKAIEAEKRSIALRLDSIEMCEVSAKRNIDRLAELKAMDSAYKEVLANVNAYFEKAASTPEFKSVLTNWIAEAAIGLDKTSAKVAFSTKSPVDEKMLRDAEKLVFDATGAKVDLSLDSQRCHGIGVVLSSLDGQISFDNELDVRLRRYQKDIRKIVQEENARQNNR